MKIKENYCAFVDVLGYGNIVTSASLTTEEKIEIFEAIYMNLFQSISQSIKQINQKIPDKIFIKSFSDSVYFESKEPLPILFSLYNAFNITFKYYSNFSFEEKYTPLLRSGIVRDWTSRIMDISSLSRQDFKVMYENEEFQNVIGLGVARAYYTSEFSKLSGMRIIVGKEVIDKLDLVKFNDVPFECYYTICPNFLFDERLEHDQKEFKLFFTPVKTNEEKKECDVYEICWPVFTYGWNKNKSDLPTDIEELYKMQHNFNDKTQRHLKKTAEIIYKSLLITVAQFPDLYSKKSVEGSIIGLQSISGITL